MNLIKTTLAMFNRKIQLPESTEYQLDDGRVVLVRLYDVSNSVCVYVSNLNDIENETSYLILPLDLDNQSVVNNVVQFIADVDVNLNERNDLAFDICKIFQAVKK